jgi:hypothetical protein
VKARKVHKIVGLILLLPFISWSLTAVFFLVRPRYEQAYENLAVRQYPMQAQPAFLPGHDWLEYRYFNSILGEHLLVKTGEGWRNLDPDTLLEVPEPGPADLKRLVEDAFAANPQRYGHVAALDPELITTDTGVRITWNWDSMSLDQEGRDTRAIARVYDIHYLEWTGIYWLDKVLGLSGLFLLIYMTWSGMKLAFGWHLPRPAPQAAR